MAQRVEVMTACNLLNWMSSLGTHQEVFPEEAKIADDDIPDIEFSLLKCLLRLPSFLLGFLTCTPGKVDRILERMHRETREGLAVELDECSDAELVSLLRSTYRMLLESTESFLLFGIVLTYQALLYELCGRWLGESGKVGASRLLAGLGTNDNANAGLELWRLAVRARSDPDLETAVLAGTDFKGLREAVERTEAGIGFLEEWKGFMTRHGHHCRGEIELFNPRWSETPDELLVQLRSYVRAIGEEDFLARYEGLEADRAEAEKACRRKLRNPLKRLAFAVVLRKAQRHAAVRENVKSEIVRRLAAARLMLLKLGERLTRRGVLSDRDEVFFLELDELESVLRPEKPVELAEKIRVRRSEYESNLVLTPPPVVVGRFDPERHVSAAVDTTTSTFKGIAVHPGVVTGPARVILRAGSDEVKACVPGENTVQL